MGLAMWWWLGVWVVLLGVSLALDGRRRTRAVLRDWDLVLTQKGQRALRTTEVRLEAELALVDWTYSQARESQDTGRTDEAMRLLDQGCELIEVYCPNMLRALAGLSALSRMVAAMGPVEPLRARAFRLRQIEGLALIHAFFHQLVVTTGERFRLRAYFLARGFTAIWRVVVGATRRAKQTRPAEHEWRQLESARHDVRTLSDEWLESFRVLLMSLAAERKA